MNQSLVFGSSLSILISKYSLFCVVLAKKEKVKISIRIKVSFLDILQIKSELLFAGPQYPGYPKNPNGSSPPPSDSPTQNPGQYNSCCFLMGQPRPLFCLFLVFSNKQYIFTTNQCEKCSPSLRYCNSNPRPLERESPLITARPGLPPNIIIVMYIISRIFHL